MKNNKIVWLSNLILNSTALLFLLINGIIAVFAYDVSKYFLAIVSLAIGVFLISQGGYKTIRSMLKKKVPNLSGIVHTFSFSMGILLLYIGLISFPAINAFSITSLVKFTGWIYFIGAITAGVEILVK